MPHASCRDGLQDSIVPLCCKGAYYQRLHSGLLPWPKGILHLLHMWKFQKVNKTRMIAVALDSNYLYNGGYQRS